MEIDSRIGLSVCLSSHVRAAVLWASGRSLKETVLLWIEFW
jgi:hypothetical protein